MLLTGSRMLQFMLLLGLSVAYAQNYDSEYRSEYDGDEGSEYSEGSDKPDYSKYYSVDNSAPILAHTKSSDAAGFTSPAEFSGFFGHSHFEFGAASNQEPTKVEKQQVNGFVTPHELQSGFAQYKAQFGGHDYFEEAQKQQKVADDEDKDNYEVKPGPSYVSHKIVPPAPSSTEKQNIKYASEVNDLNKDYQENYNPYKTLSTEKTSKPLDDYNRQNYDHKPKPTQEVEKQTSYDFDFGKLQYPYPVAKQTVVDPKYLPQFTPSTPQDKSPYQKYSFQPISPTAEYTSYSPALQNYNFEKYTTAVPSYDYSPSEQVSKLVKNKNCRKIYKPVPQKSISATDSMDCYVCKDEKNGGNYEQCSYGSASNPKNYYVESSKKYSQPANTNIDNYRYKRYTVDDDEKEERDPYEYIKAESKKQYSKPDDFESKYYKPKNNDDHNEEYRFGPEYFDDEEKSSSEKHSEELAKSGENCKKEIRDGMVCMVCKNSKTGGNYEQCSYSSAPAEKKYAYVKEKTYNSEDDDPEEETESTEDKPINEKQFSGRNRKGEKGRQIDEVERVKPKTTHRQRAKAKQYSIPKHFEESNLKNRKNSRRNQDSDDDGTEESARYNEKPLESPNQDNYYYKHFPEYTKEESKNEETKAEPEDYGYYGDGAQKKDVEEVLAEFAKKDRSTCKKAEKNGMTCYLCKDKKGVEHEECMYVSESRPESKYASYHAKQATKEKDPDNEESVLKPTVVPSALSKRKRFPKKSEPQLSESIKVTTVVPVVAPKKVTRVYRRTKNIPHPSTSTVNEPVVAESQNVPTVEKQSHNKSSKEDQYRTEGEEGAFADETKSVYSKALGFSLPKFMLTKSEGERIYDEFVKT